MLSRNDPATVLIVEDEAIIGLSQQEVLESAGLVVVSATSGEEACALVQGGTQVDLVLMDIDLGTGMTGTEAAQRILREREVPIVFLTSHAEERVVETVKGISRYGYVLKDSGEFVLVETVERALELYRAHSALKSAEARFRHIISDIRGVAVQGYLPDGTTTFWNQASETIYGYSAEEALGRKLWDLIIQDSIRDEVQQSVRRMAQTGVPHAPGELSLRRKDNTLVDVYSSHSVTRRPDGEVELFCIDIDLTERNHAQGKLRHLNRVFGSLGTDPEENIHTFVGETCELLGGVCSLYNKLENEGESLCTWAGSNLPEGYDPTDAPSGHICYEATMHNKDTPVILGELKGTSYEESDPNVRKYGLRAYLGYPVVLHGQSAGSLCVVDTKPRKFNQTDLHIIATLAKAVELEEERKHVVDRVHHLLAEQELLVREVHHRAKNDMMLIRSLLSVQASRSESPEARAALIDASRRVAMTGRVYERLSASGQPQTVDLRLLIGGIVDDLKGGVVPPEVTVEVSVEAVTVDTRIATAVGVILNELITNSVKYGFDLPAGVVVSISVDAPTDEGLHVRVRDNGRGFPPEILDGTRYSFGLTIVRAMVDQHDGRLSLANDSGAVAEIDIKR